MSDVDNEFTAFLEELLSLERIEGVAAGITKKVIAQGRDSLSQKQDYVFQKEVLDEYVYESCDVCCNSIPWSEMVDAYDNGGNCGRCEYLMNKDD